MESDRGLKRKNGLKGGGQDNAVAGDGRPVKFTRPSPLPGKAKNYAVWNLNEPESAAHKSWQSTIRKFRLWCYNTSSDRFHFGNDRRRSCRVPESGHFLVYIHYKNRWMVAVIDGPSGYLTGYITRSVGKDKRIRENRTSLSSKMSKKERNELRKKLPLYIEDAEMLPWTGSYKYIDTSQLGYPNLVNSFMIVHKKMEGIQPLPSIVEVTAAGEILILHLPEAGRSDRIYVKIDTCFCFIDGIDNQLGIILLEEVRNWAKRSNKALKITEDVTPNKWQVKRKGKEAGYHEIQCLNEDPFEPGMKPELDILEDIRLFYRELPNNGKFELRKLPVHLGPNGPLSNDLDEELMENSQDHKSSLFLIEPFLPFNRGSDSVSSEIKPSRTEKDSEDASQFNATSENLMNKAKSQALDVSGHKIGDNRHSAGIYNLGNTCYASCALQYFHCVPELTLHLAKYLEGPKNVYADQGSHDLAQVLHETIVQLSQEAKPIHPDRFMKALRGKYKDFNEKEGTLYRQQDMAECRMRLIETLSHTLITEGSGPSSDPIKCLFGIELTSRAQNATEERFGTVYQLNCGITDDIDHMDAGIRKVLLEEDSKINKLPRYLTVNFHRVDCTRGKLEKKNQQVEFPSEWDVYKYCSHALKHEIRAKRKGSITNVGEYTGLYELIAVVTHEGTADRGHYVTFVRQEDGCWMQFDDERKSIWLQEQVLNLCGGDERPMACICLYKSSTGTDTINGSGTPNGSKNISEKVCVDLKATEAEAKKPGSSMSEKEMIHLEDLPQFTVAYKELINKAQSQAPYVPGHKTGDNRGSVGIYNLGNTCYASCALQYFNCVPELHLQLARYLKGPKNVNADPGSDDLVQVLHKTILQLNQNVNPIHPKRFMKALRAKYEDFNEKEGRLYRQQDMAECRMRLIETLSHTLITEGSGPSSDPIKCLFGIELTSRAQNATEEQFGTVYQLNCGITDDVDHMDAGIREVLLEEDSKINKLPRYLTVNFHRVDYTRGKLEKKIQVKLFWKFPSEWDVYKYCSHALKHEIRAKRKGSITNVGEYTGLYELIAVVTHEGTADRGHYVTFVRQEDGCWMQFDDERKSIWLQEQVLNLCGGDEHPMACICLYKSSTGVSSGST